MEALILRLEGPLMAFGGPMVDENGVVDRFPSASMMAGLLANALGYDHSEPKRIQRLQDRLVFGARLDRPGRRIVDYQTVDLGQAFMDGTGWTTWGRPMGRKGGSASTGTHIRYRYYVAGAVCTAALSLEPAEGTPNLDDLERALKEPERPVFLGRKTCLPSERILRGRMSGGGIRQILGKIPSAHGRRLEARWPVSEGGTSESREVSLTDERDWGNQIHCGERRVWEGWIEVRGDRHE